jgi:subtilase family serine protease
MRRRRSSGIRPVVEGLDDRCLLSGPGLSPARVASAYGLAGLTYGGTAANGAGQTIAIVDAYNDPNISTELAVFDAANGLPAPPSLTVLGQSGTSAPPHPDVGWAQEIAMDVEWAHALAPGAALVLVEANSTNLRDLMAAVATAKKQPGVSVVSMSWGGTEDAASAAYDSMFAASGITFVASSGDDGPGSGAEWPASSPYVVGVGGTTLQVGADGTYQGETVWQGTSGGISTLEPEPSYQAHVQFSGFRSTPDVAFDADTATGVQIYAMNPFNNQAAWLTFGGTSLGAPAWSAIVAIADQGRVLGGAAALASNQTLNAIYSLPTSAFHPIGVGYSTRTGLGTPNGANLVNGLVSFDARSVGTTQVGLPAAAGSGTDGPGPVLRLPVSAQPVGTVSLGNVPTTSTTSTTTITTTTPPPAATPVSARHKKHKVKHQHANAHARHLHHRALTLAAAAPSPGQAHRPDPGAPTAGLSR